MCVMCSLLVCLSPYLVNASLLIQVHMYQSSVYAYGPTQLLH